VGHREVRWGAEMSREGPGLKHHARLLSSGFYRRVYASSASERASSFRIADNDDDEEEED